MSSQDKMLSLLDAFSAEHPVWSSEDLVAFTGLPPSTCYRYLKSLHEAGLLARVGSGSYAIGPRVLALDRVSRMTDPVYSVGSPTIKTLTQTTGFSSLLSVLYSGSVMCVQQELTADAPAGLFGRGQQRPLVAGATANVILANLPGHQLKGVYGKNLELISASGLGADWDQFRASLKAIRSRGYSISMGEYRPGIAGIAAALFNREGEVLGSIALATSTRSKDLERFRSLAPDVMEAARLISAGIASTANTVDLPARAPG